MFLINIETLVSPSVAPIIRLICLLSYQQRQESSLTLSKQHLIKIKTQINRKTYQKRKDSMSCNALINGTEASVHCKLFHCSNKNNITKQSSYETENLTSFTNQQHYLVYELRKQLIITELLIKFTY